MLQFPVNSKAQENKSYEFLPAPDLWYNDVDGIRVGLRVRGQVPGTFNDGPHRLDSGVWLGTWFPENPVSYYISFTEPIPSISGFGSEANVQFISSIRTGFQQHGIHFNKRWQNGFEERNYKEFTLALRAEDRFDKEYLLYPGLWSSGTLYLVGLQMDISDDNGLGRYTLSAKSTFNVAGSRSFFSVNSIEWQQLISLSSYFDLRIRNFAGLATNEADAQFLFSRSFKPAKEWMESGLTRAKGTIPTIWMEEGIIQVAGGANLRGYLNQETDNLLNQPAGEAPILKSIGALNVELDYPNPINTVIKKTPVIGGIMSLRSYMFFDTGTSLGFTDQEEARLLSDAGAGFMLSINIPDQLGKPRGLMIRYDLPFWLSNPQNSDHFEFRNIIGIGAVITL